jgi:hypothetical protein
MTIQAYRTLLVIKKALIRLKSFVGLIIAGVLALVSLIASAVTSTVGLSQNIQTAHYVNHLSKNVSLTLLSQEAI